MVSDGLRWFAMSPDLAWPSGSDLERPWTDPDPTWSGHGPTRRRFWIGWDRIGSDWIRLDRVWIGLDRIWIGSWCELGPSWMQTERAECEKSLFFHWFRKFYVCLGNISLHAVLGPNCSQLELTWVHLGPTLDRLGPNFVRLGVHLGEPSATWSRSWPS